MHTILGAGGPVSNALALELEKAAIRTRLVSRRQIKPVSPTTEWKKGDLTNPHEVSEAVKGSEVVYLCAGLKYDADVWQDQWPLIMKNVVEAVKRNNARLIFFDNVYMYGLVKGKMTEETPYQPISKKGEVRATIATYLMEQANAGNISASIARAPDFYGATASMNSFFDMMVLDKLSKKQKALWIGNVNSLHSFIYVPDAAKAVFMLGQTPESDKQIWHLPTAPALRGKEFLSLAANAFNEQPTYRRVNKLMLQSLGLFNKAIKGTVEMYYQYQYDYNFCSHKFEQAFGLAPTPYRDSFRYLADTFYKR